MLADVVDEGNENSSGMCTCTRRRESNENTTFLFRTDKMDDSPKLGTTILAKSATPPALDELELGHVPPTHRENSVRYFRNSLRCGMHHWWRSIQQNITLTSPSGHFPHFWTEGGPICSKLCHGTVSGPTVDVVRRDAQ